MTIRIFSSLCLILSCLITGWTQSTSQDQNEVLKTLRADDALVRLIEKIKELKEPQMRVFLRYRMASYLWGKKITGKSLVAEQLAVAALDDIDLHKNDIKSSDATYYKSSILALLRTYAPDSADKLSLKYKEESRSDNFNVADSMLSSKDSSGKAIEIVEQSIKNGEDGGLALVVFLSDLKKVNSDGYLKLLNDIVLSEASMPDRYSIKTLYMLRSMYLAEGIPIGLRSSFLSIVIIRAEEIAQRSGSDDTVTAFNLLRALQGQFSSLDPPLPSRANNAMIMLGQSVPGGVSTHAAAESRIEGSSDPLRQVSDEIDASTAESDKDSFRIQGVRLALNKGELKSAVDFAIKINDKGRNGDLRDSLLEDIADAAIKKRNDEMAEYSVSQIKTAIRGSAALKKLAIYYFDSKDLIRARGRLDDSLRKIESLDNNSEKALKLFEIIPTIERIDNLRVIDVIREAINATNKLPSLTTGSTTGSPDFEAYITSLVNISWQVIPAFRTLCQRDENGCYGLLTDISSNEIRAAALCGITIQLFDATIHSDQVKQ